MVLKKVSSPFSIIFESFFKERWVKLKQKRYVCLCAIWFSKKNDSTTLAIAQLQEYILHARDKENTECCLFLDVAKAFDTGNHNILLQILERYGIRGIPLELFKSYLYDSKQAVVNVSCPSRLRKMEIGVPQGSVLGPFFLLYINDLAKCSNLSATLYADDSVLITGHDDAKKLQYQINKQLSKVDNWLKINRLSTLLKQIFVIH